MSLSTTQTFDFPLIPPKGDSGASDFENEWGHILNKGEYSDGTDESATPGLIQELDAILRGDSQTNAVGNIFGGSPSNSNSVAVGSSASSSGSGGAASVSIGNSTAQDNGDSNGLIAIGNNSVAYGGGAVAVGANADAGDPANDVWGNNCVAIGQDTEAKGGFGGHVAFPLGTVNGSINCLAFPAGTVSNQPSYSVAFGNATVNGVNSAVAFPDTTNSGARSISIGRDNGIADVLRTAVTPTFDGTDRVTGTDLNNSEYTFYVDENNSNFVIRYKNSSGTVKTGTVSLS